LVRVSWHFQHNLVPSCHPTISVKALKENKTVNPTSGLAYPFFIHYSTPNGMGNVAFTLALSDVISKGQHHPIINV